MKKIICSLVLLVIFLSSNVIVVSAYHRPTTASSSILLRGDLSAIAADTMTGRVYVADYFANRVHVLIDSGMTVSLTQTKILSEEIMIDPETMAISGLKNPVALALDGDKLYIANSFTSTPLSIANIPTGYPSLIHTQDISVLEDNPSNGADFSPETEPLISGGIGIFSRATSSQGASKSIFISDYSKDRVIIFDTQDMNSARFTNVGSGPGGIAVDLDDGRVYVANTNDMSISVISVSASNSNQEAPSADSQKIAVNPLGLVFNPGGIPQGTMTMATEYTARKKLHISSNYYNPSSLLTGELDLLRRPTGLPNTNVLSESSEPVVSSNTIALNPTTQKIYTVDHVRNLLIVSDAFTNTFLKSYDIHGPRSVAVNPILKRVYVGTSLGILYTFNEDQLCPPPPGGPSMSAGCG